MTTRDPGGIDIPAFYDWPPQTALEIAAEFLDSAELDMQSCNEDELRDTLRNTITVARGLAQLATAESDARKRMLADIKELAAMIKRR